MTRRRAILILVISIFDAVHSETAGAQIPNLDEVRFEQHLNQKLPLETIFSDEYSQRKPISNHFGVTPVILVFTYYRCPNLCTLVLNGLVQALREIPGTIGKDYQVLAVSIDPSEKPTLALAKRRSYLARLGISETHENQARLLNRAPWHFLTGTEAQIRGITTSAGFHYHRDPETGEYAHPSGIVVVTPEGHISQYFFGIQFDPKKLDQALRVAVLGKKGSWVEEILLYCFHYDPKLSHKGPLIMGVIRITGAIGALGVFILLAYLFSTRKKETSV